jgi:hypothetical protein
VYDKLGYEHTIASVEETGSETNDAGETYDFAKVTFTTDTYTF